MDQEKDTTGVNFQMDNGLYRRMKIKLAMDLEQLKTICHIWLNAI